MVGNGPREPVGYDGPPATIWEKIGAIALVVVVLMAVGAYVLWQIVRSL